MGNCVSLGSSGHAIDQAEEFEMTYELMEIVDRWKLTDGEVRFLYSRFQLLDSDGSGQVDFDEFFAFMNEKRNLFLDSMFKLIVGDNTELSFARWIVAVFAFCLSTRREMLEQVFISFDVNQDGYLSLAELHQFLMTVHSDNAIFPKEIVHSLTEQNLARNGKMSFDDFLEAERRYPMLLWPVFRMQHRMRKTTLGLRFFQKIDRRMAHTYLQDHHADAIKKKWQARKEILLLYCCSFPCCLRSQARVPPTLLTEVRARKRDLRRMREANQRRVTKPSGPTHTYKGLGDQLERPYHEVTDELIERDILQIHCKPLKSVDLITEPKTLLAVDENGDEYSLSESDGDDQGHLTDVGEDEYPDMFEEELQAQELAMEDT